MMWTFRRTANRQALGAEAKRVQAHVVEFWLFADEPALIWQFWRDLLRANARLIALLAVPLFILSAPMIPLFFLLDAIYGHAALPVGRPALVTIGLARDAPESPVLSVPDGIRVESPPVRVPGAREVSWRIRPGRPLSGALRVSMAGSSVEKSIRTGSDFAWLSPKRVQSIAGLIRYPTETPLPPGAVEWIDVSYPAASVAFAGLDAHWLNWFTVFTVAGAILAAKAQSLVSR
jgi:hypothetical protein